MSEQLVGRGMIADFALHQPDKEDGGIPNPHFYVLCPIRPIEPDGKWGCKQRRRYRLDKDVNRWIRKANNILRDIRKKIAGLTDWIKAIKEELSQPQAPTLAALLTDYYEGRNAGAWSRNAKIGNLKDFAEAVNFLTERGIVTLEDLEAHIAAQGERAEAINTSMKAKHERLNELKELLHLVDLYRDTKPIYDEWKGINRNGKPILLTSRPGLI